MKFIWRKAKKAAPQGQLEERVWFEFEPCVDGDDREELDDLLARSSLTRRELALLVTGVRVRLGPVLRDLDTERTAKR